MNIINYMHSPIKQKSYPWDLRVLEQRQNNSVRDQYRIDRVCLDQTNKYFTSNSPGTILTPHWVLTQSKENGKYI